MHSNMDIRMAVAVTGIHTAEVAVMIMDIRMEDHHHMVNCSYRLFELKSQLSHFQVIHTTTTVIIITTTRILF
jgi:hypothetical protein